MAIFLDTADVVEAREAAQLGFVAGITTNPILIAKAGERPDRIIAALCEAISGIVFHQLTAPTFEGMEAEATKFLALAPGRVGLKIPCNLAGIRLASAFSSKAVCAITGVYSAAQAYVCSEGSAHYVIPYVNRAGRKGIEPLGLVKSLVAAVTASGRGTEVLGASIKSPVEAADVLCAGAKHVTVPWQVLRAMADHPLTSEALEEFAAAAGIPQENPVRGNRAG